MGKKKNQENENQKLTPKQAIDYIDSMAPGLMAFVVKDKWPDFTVALKIIRDDIYKNAVPKKTETKK